MVAPRPSVPCNLRKHMQTDRTKANEGNQFDNTWHMAFRRKHCNVTKHNQMQKYVSNAENRTEYNALDNAQANKKQLDIGCVF